MELRVPIVTVQNLHKGGEGLLRDENGKTVFDDTWIHRDILDKEVVDDLDLEDFFAFYL